MKKSLLLLNCLFLCLAAQAQCNMQGYSRQMAKADSCIKASNYKMAQEHYNAAKIYCDTKSDEVDVAKDKLFESIDKLRKEADQQRQIAQTALQKAQKLIDAFYFYEDKFALAYGKLDLNNVFYFIDKNGDEITKLGQWTKAEQFDDIGFAKVENLYCPKCLLDTSGNTYPVAYDLKDLNPDITALDLSWQELNSLPEEVRQNTQLKVLLLNGNQLSTLPESIEQLSNLQTLGLSYNQLSTLPESIGQLSNLQVLDLRGNQLNTLPQSIGQLSKCERLDLNDNKLTTLPQSIGQLSNLKTLNLGIIILVGVSVLDGGDNQLTTLPESICQLSNLQTLDLSANKLTTLPQSIGQLSNLQTLDLSGNKLSSLPQSIEQLNKCKRLDLGFNQLTTLPKSIWQLSNLQTLNLSRNQLSTLPESIGQLSNLQTLYLHDNQLSTLPQSIAKLSNLQALHLFGNNALSPYDNYLENEELKAFLAKLSKGEVKFKGYMGLFNEQLDAYKQDSTNSDNWFMLSRSALFVNKPQIAIAAAQKVLSLDSTNVSIETNLALGYLLNNQYPQAEAIYLKWKGKSFPDDERNCNDTFLQDIAVLEAAGITHPNFEKVKQLLKE